MSLIITFMFDPAKLQMNCASASGASSLRVETERRATSTGRTHHGRGNRSRTRGARGVGNHSAARLFSLVISMGSSAACSAVARPNCDQVAQLSPPPVGWARSVPPPPSAPLSRRGPKSGPACQRSSTEWRSLATRIGCDPPCARSPSCSPEVLLPIVVLDLADRLEADRARWHVACDATLPLLSLGSLIRLHRGGGCAAGGSRAWGYSPVRTRRHRAPHSRAGGRGAPISVDDGAERPAGSRSWPVKVSARRGVGP